MDLVLLNLPFRISPYNPGSGNAMPPLWMAYIAGTLRAEAVPFSLVDALGEGLDQRWELEGRHYRGLSPDEILDRMPGQPKVIAVSCMFSSAWPLARHLLGLLKERFPQSRLVLGGEHATAMTELVFQESAVDVVVQGEGEETAAALFKKLLDEDGLQGLEGMAGIAWRGVDGTVHQENRRSRLKAIDAIPPPNWEGIPLTAYTDQKCGTGAYRGAYMPILATRGCPYQCTFCTSPNMWTTKWVAREPALVVQEMLGYQQQFGAIDFQFQDLTAVLSEKWIMEFCEQIHVQGLKATWQFPTGTRSEAIGEKTARAMFAAGCTNFALPFESGDVAVLDRMKKRVNTGRQFAAGRAALAAGIQVGGFVMVGLPYETRKSLVHTWWLVVKAAFYGFREMSVHSFVPLPGTHDFRELLAQGKIPEGDELYDHIYHWFAIGKNTSYSPVLGDRALRAFVVFCLASFFLTSWMTRPWRLVNELMAVAKGGGDSGRLAKLMRGQLTLRRLKVIPARVVSGKV